MATVLLRNLSEDFHLRLKEMAKLDKRSVPAEVASLLEDAAEKEARRVAMRQALAELDENRRNTPRQPVDSLTLLRESRDER
jgi:plasmid stability protein